MRRQVIFIAILLLLQSCKVVVEDPEGNRLGDIDSLNWDSLFSSPGNGVYSSWEWPLSSWTIPDPYSSQTAPSSSTNPSSSTDANSSSDEAQSSSSSGICSTFTIATYSKDTLYTWKELYADGSVEIQWSLDTAAYYGTAPLTFTLANNIVYQSPLPAPVYSTEYLCEGEKDFDLADSNGLIKRMGAAKDTIFMNYGPLARGPLVAPQVSILDKVALQSKVDSIPSKHYWTAIPNVKHFRGDSMRISLLGPDWIRSYTTPPTYITSYPDACTGETPTTPTPLVTGPYDSAESPRVPLIIGNPDEFVEAGVTLHWQLRVRNRFGYRDVVQFQSFLQAPNCP